MFLCRTLFSIDKQSTQEAMTGSDTSRNNIRKHERLLQWWTFPHAKARTRKKPLIQNQLLDGLRRIFVGLEMHWRWEMNGRRRCRHLSYFNSRGGKAALECQIPVELGFTKSFVAANNDPQDRMSVEEEWFSFNTEGIMLLCLLASLMFFTSWQKGRQVAADVRQRWWYSAKIQLQSPSDRHSHCFCFWRTQHLHKTPLPLVPWISTSLMRIVFLVSDPTWPYLTLSWKVSVACAGSPPAGTSPLLITADGCARSHSLTPPWKV